MYMCILFSRIGKHATPLPLMSGRIVAKGGIVSFRRESRLMLRAIASGTVIVIVDYDKEYPTPIYIEGRSRMREVADAIRIVRGSVERGSARDRSGRLLRGVQIALTWSSEPSLPSLRSRNR